MSVTLHPWTRLRKAHEAASIHRHSRFSIALACALLAHAAVLLGLRPGNGHAAAEKPPLQLCVSLEQAAAPSPAPAQPAHPAPAAHPAAPAQSAPAKDAATLPAPPPPLPSAIPGPAAAAPAPPAGDSAAPVTPPRFEAAYLSNPEPEYPRLSRELGEEGKTLLMVKVSVQGQPLEIQATRSSGFERLDQAAIATVWRWRFIPARRGSEPLEAWVQVPIRFNLRKPANASL